MKVLAKTLGMDHREWLQHRQKGIGGSDVGAILGVNKWKSPIKVYLDKVEEITEVQEQSEAAYWGNNLEDMVAKEFAKRTGKKVRKRNELMQHNKYPWMIANIDREVVGEKSILECKTANQYLAKEWENDNIPASYILQCQHYMAVMDYERCYIACLIGGQRFVHYTIDRDEELITVLIEKEKNFWLNYVEKKEPPAIDGSKASSELLSKLYPASNSNSIELSKDMEKLINEKFQLKSNIEQIEDRVNEIDNILKQSLEDNECGLTEKFKVTWRNYNRASIDSKKIKADCPEIYKKYIKTSNYRKFDIKER